MKGEGRSGKEAKEEKKRIERGTGGAMGTIKSKVKRRGSRMMRGEVSGDRKKLNEWLIMIVCVVIGMYVRAS